MWKRGEVRVVETNYKSSYYSVDMLNSLRDLDHVNHALLHICLPPLFVILKTSLVV